MVDVIVLGTIGETCARSSRAFSKKDMKSFFRLARLRLRLFTAPTRIQIPQEANRILASNSVVECYAHNVCCREFDPRLAKNSFFCYALLFWCYSIVVMRKFAKLLRAVRFCLTPFFIKLKWPWRNGKRERFKIFFFGL